MSDLLCVTNRKLCKEPFLERMEKIAMCRPSAVILREKDLTECEYQDLAGIVLQICCRYNVPCILHTFTDTAVSLGVKNIHLPFALFRSIDPRLKKNFDVIGVSCHSVEEAAEAALSGASYITAGHIYPTDCKKGLTARGTDFLSSVCNAVDIPVYAIGGITKYNINEVSEAGADGVCIMSGLMRCDNVTDYISSIKKELINSAG